MTKRMTSPEKKAAATERELRNPLTGQAPNSYTQVTNRDLPSAVNVRQFEGDGRERGRLHRAHQEATRPGGVVDAQIGYQKPQGMSDRSFAWVAGAHHSFPNTAADRGVPAINEPHEAHPGVTVQRRAEDLSGKEYRKGEAVLAHYGHSSKDPVGSLRDTQARTLNRVIGEHAQAGVEESSSQLFYGGQVNSDIADPDMDARHTSGVRAANQRFRDSVTKMALHPQFKANTPHLSHSQRMSAATNLMAQSVADTSPNAKWRDKDRWPNIEQAEESAHAGLTGDQPAFVTGRIQNVHKAAGRVAEMMDSQDFDSSKYGNAKTSPKTIAFRGALVDKDAADAYKVSDVHEASVIAPGHTTAKSKAYTGHDGNRLYTHPDDPKSKSKGLQPVWDGKVDKQKVGLSRPEEMLAKGGGLVHALNDRATREVLASHGLSRSVNHADNVHSMQAATWGSQQMRRPDVNISHADQYPVVRNWAGEGHTTLTAQGRGLFPDAPRSLGEQFTRNPNTSRNADTPKTKPYPVMPGEAR